MSKSPWGNIGAWAADAEAEEQEEAARAAAAAASGSFPSLKEAANSKQQKKKTTKMSLHEFTMQQTTNEMLRLPTGPTHRSPGDGRLGGGFSNYGEGNGRRSYGGFEDDRRSRVSDFDQQQHSRADEVDNWASAKKPFPSAPDTRTARSDRHGAGSRAEGNDNWAGSRKPMSSFGSGFREPDRWNRDASFGRQRLVLESDKNANGEGEKGTKPSPFGAARPREEVLAEKGLDWKKVDLEIGAKNGMSNTQSSRPGSSNSSRSESITSLQGAVEGEVKHKPKVNPFGDAKPREVALEEKGLDWRKIDLELEHRRVHRPEEQEEKNLKEEIEQLKKESQECGVDNQAHLQEMINQKERDLELLIRELDDKVRFSKNPIERPRSGSSRAERASSQLASHEERRTAEVLERPGSRGRGEAWAGPSDPVVSRPRGGIDVWATPKEQVDRPRSRDAAFVQARPNAQVERPRARGGENAWARSGDERRASQGGRGGFFGSWDADRSRVCIEYSACGT